MANAHQNGLQIPIPSPRQRLAAAREHLAASLRITPGASQRAIWKLLETIRSVTPLV